MRQVKNGQVEVATLATETKVNIKPLGDRVVIRPAQREEVTASGVILPDTAKEKPQRGTVLAVGPGKLNDNGQRVPLEVSEGAEVLYAKYAGTEIKIEGEDLLIVSEKDILAIV
jgi:chaperonin GroES